MWKSSPARKTIARKPSHLGSKSQPSPAGSSVASLASMGSTGGSIANAVAGTVYPPIRSGTSGSEVPQGLRHGHPRRTQGRGHSSRQAHEESEQDAAREERRRHLEGER